MLSIGKLGVAGGADYYLAKVANSVDDYYLGRGEAPGQWIGTAAQSLGLTGEVRADELRNVLGAMSPSGEGLGVRSDPGRRPGYDLTFSAPKGASLLWAFGSPEVQQMVAAAHDRAVVAVLDHLSSEACYARRGSGGNQLIEAEGFIGAAFRHRTSRAGDPQLHTHVVVPNLVLGADGRWCAPDGRQLYFWQKTAGTLYQSALRAELAPLGLAWQVRRNGLGELRDIPRTILRGFSKRRADIESAMEVRGATSAKAAETAALATRQRKPDMIAGGDVLRQDWFEQLATISLADGSGETRPAIAADIVEAIGQASAGPPTPDHIEAGLRVLTGEGGVSLDDWEIDEHLAPDTRALPVTLLGSTFTRREALAAVARAFDVTPEEADTLTAQLLSRSSVVRVLADPVGGDLTVRTCSGRIVPVTAGDRRYTTTELLAAEERIVASATARVGEGPGRVDPATTAAALASHPHLDDEQAAGVHQLLTSGNGCDLVIGQAGTGKSTMLAAARAGWEQAGYRVIGTAVAARTAADLQAGTGIPSSSLTQLLADLRDGGGLDSRHVVVVDEASMVGSRPLDRLRAHVDAAGAKLVLVGDNRQLSSIDAGGAIRTLAGQLGPHVVTLTTNRRQGGADQQWEREALVTLREGKVTPAVAAYAEHGRITVTDTIDEARQRIVDDWWAVHHTHTTAILAVRRADVIALNDLVHARRQAAGELGPQITVGAGSFAVGDRILLGRNQRVPTPAGQEPASVGVRNGTFGTIIGPAETPAQAATREGDVTLPENHGADGALVPVRQHEAGLVVQLDDGTRVILPAEYAETAVSLGYALTVFRSQGITVDHTFGLGGDSLFQEAGYTQLSRGRLTNNLYVATADNPRWDIGHHLDDTAQPDALETLVAALSRSEEQTMAHDHLPTSSLPDSGAPADRSHGPGNHRRPDRRIDALQSALGGYCQGPEQRPSLLGPGSPTIPGKDNLPVNDVATWLGSLWERVRALDGSQAPKDHQVAGPEPPIRRVGDIHHQPEAHLDRGFDL